MRKRKWWWSIWMWGVQVLLVNAYVLYKSAHLLIWKTPKKDIMSQYHFRKSIVLDWFGFGKENDADAVAEKHSDETSRRRKIESISQFSLTSDEANSTKRATRVTEQTLDPYEGALRIRLQENLEHYPIVSKVKRPCCSL